MGLCWLFMRKSKVCDKTRDHHPVWAHLGYAQDIHPGASGYADILLEAFACGAKLAMGPPETIQRCWTCAAKMAWRYRECMRWKSPYWWGQFWRWLLGVHCQWIKLHFRWMTHNTSLKKQSRLSNRLKSMPGTQTSNPSYWIHALDFEYEKLKPYCLGNQCKNRRNVRKVVHKNLYYSC